MSKNDSVLKHDINSNLSSIMSALDLINDEWKKNPELVDKILPLTAEKFELLQDQMRRYRSLSDLN